MQLNIEHAHTIQYIFFTISITIPRMIWQLSKKHLMCYLQPLLKDFRCNNSFNLSQFLANTTFDLQQFSVSIPDQLMNYVVEFVSIALFSIEHLCLLRLSLQYRTIITEQLYSCIQFKYCNIWYYTIVKRKVFFFAWWHCPILKQVQFISEFNNSKLCLIS